MNTFELLQVNVFLNYENGFGSICVNKNSFKNLNKKENDIIIINKILSKNYHIVKILEIINDFKSYGIDFLTIKVQILEVGEN